ncbi:hypothetical protein SAMN05192574_102916 [Mucilaginibacter gossypiicola]|uniref:Uncharacterized protein n=1 Tax=Mucilaginibacter gossypiicola TaxID=551995 RepID=A0A1H8F0C6_9SPHI|nr:hypothetical protein [Mucilaginibacter gossypiicola]SEN25311.1 hypothetical protein SAMN05192574_102916 [Mucilaginibacter gossypiicola]
MIKKLKWLLDYFFLYVDEHHCFATEPFRNDILIPFRGDWVWKFKNRAFGSATPFEYSDPRFANEQHYKLRYSETFGKITIVNDSKPRSVLNYMLTHPEMFPGRVYIFFNTVTESGEAIRASGISDVNIYCRDEERNMVNLGEESKYFQAHPIESEYKKFNFFSCRYNEGWDLKDDEMATLILVTDVSIPHSLIGIPFKGYQAVGRLKVSPHKIYHITNNFGANGMQSFKEVQANCIYSANKYIVAYNRYIEDCKTDGMEADGLLKAMITPFSKFDADNVASINTYKHDQIICTKFCKQHYNSLATIEATWKSLNYDVDIQMFDFTPIITTKKTSAEINKQIIDQVIEWREHPAKYNFQAANATMVKYKADFELLFQAIEILGVNEIITLNYDDKAMKNALIEKSNKNQEAKLRLMLIDTFKLNNRYSKKEIKQTLQRLYNQFNIQAHTGNIKKAKAEDLNSMGLFEMRECKVNKTENGFIIDKLCYTLKKAA